MTMTQVEYGNRIGGKAHSHVMDNVGKCDGGINGNVEKSVGDHIGQVRRNVWDRTRVARIFKRLFRERGENENGQHL